MPRKQRARSPKRTGQHTVRRVHKKRATLHMARARQEKRPVHHGAVTRSTAAQGHPERSRGVSWRAPDFHLHPRGPLWGFLIVAIGGVAALLFALYGQYTLAAIVFLASLVMVLGSHDRPEILNHAVTPKGLLINNWLLSWNSIKSFWIISAPEGNKLHLETVKRGLPIVTVYLGKEDPAKVRDALAKFLPEHPTRGEQLTDVLARLLKV